MAPDTPSRAALGLDAAVSPPERPSALGFLPEPTWTTAAMSYTKDTVALAEVRRKFSDDQNKRGNERKQPDKTGDRGD